VVVDTSSRWWGDESWSTVTSEGVVEGVVKVYTEYQGTTVTDS
jgi:hypothetical protein